MDKKSRKVKENNTINWKYLEEWENAREKQPIFKKITIEQINDVVEEAKKIIMTFVKDQCNNDILNETSNALNSVFLGIDKDKKTAQLCYAYYDSGQNCVFITESFCQEAHQKVELLYVIIHEYAHVLSNLLQKGELNRVNCVLEESFANLFAEMSINNYIRKGNEISNISDQENEILKRQKGYNGQQSYIEEGEFTRAIMYALKEQGKDMEAFKEYFFGKKENFLEICAETLGSSIEKIFTVDLSLVQNYLGVEDNTSMYLPQATLKVRNLVLESCKNLQQTNIKDSKDSLYNLNIPIIDALNFERILRYEWLKKIDFSNINKRSIKKSFVNLTLEDIQNISKKSNGRLKDICSKYGYSDTIKTLIKGWYAVNKDNFSQFKKIISLTGGGISVDIFKRLLIDQKIDDVNSIMKLASELEILNSINYEDIADILGIINNKLSTKFYKSNYIKAAKNKDYSVIRLTNGLIGILSKIKLNNEELRTIMHMYSNPVSKINLDDIYNIVSIMNQIDYSTLSKEDKDELSDLFVNIAMCLNEQSKIDNLELFMQIEKLPKKFGEELKDCMIYDNFDVHDDVETAIDFLEEYGHQIQNKDEILELIKKGEYKSINIKPKLSTSALSAFIIGKDKTKILLNTYIKQFIENNNTDFLDTPEILNTCLMLLDSKNQGLLGINTEMKKEISFAIRNKMIYTKRKEIEQKNSLGKVSKSNTSIVLSIGIKAAPTIGQELITEDTKKIADEKENER